MKSKTIPVQINLTVGATPLRLNMEVPDKAVKLQELLPIFRQLDHTIIDMAIEQFVDENTEISCTKGCGECCHQLVPISQTEAAVLVELINSFPRAKRQDIFQRFEQAKEKLVDAGLWENLLDTGSIENPREFGFDYFDVKVACPFLQQGACSIHPQRPLSCREFLATSPAQYCADPRAMKIESVKIPVRLSNILSATENLDSDNTKSWTPLITIMEQAKVKKTATRLPATQWLETFFTHFTDSA